MSKLIKIIKIVVQVYLTQDIDFFYMLSPILIIFETKKLEIKIVNNNELVCSTNLNVIVWINYKSNCNLKPI